MTLHVPDQPWLCADVREASLTCKRCGTTQPGSPIGGLEHLLVRLRPFAQEHADCLEKIP